MNTTSSIALSLTALLMFGCSDDPSGCQNDLECKGDRICVGGACVAPDGASGPAADSGAPDDSGGGRDTDAAPFDPVGACSLVGVTQGELETANPVLLGTLLPRTGPLANYGVPMERGIALALSEINEAGGIGGRPVGAIACDSETDMTAGKAAMAHLADARLPAVIGAAASSVTLPVFEDAAHPRYVLMMSPSSTSPAISTLDDDNLLWRTAPSDSDQGAGVVRNLLEEGYPRVAMVHRDDAYGQGIANTIEARYCSTGTCSQSTWLRRGYPAHDWAAALDALVDSVTQFQADVVVLVSFSDDGLGLLDALRAAGITSFVATDGLRTAELSDHLKTAEERCSLLGFAAAPLHGPTYEAFALRFEAHWSEAPGAFVAHAYDATYALAYALAAARGADGESPLGPQVAAALLKITNGQGIEVGPTDWPTGISAITADGSPGIDLAGASGDLNFDANGDVSGEVGAWRVDPATGEIVELGVVLDGDGQYHAPPPCAE